MIFAVERLVDIDAGIEVCLRFIMTDRAAEQFSPHAPLLVAQRAGRTSALSPRNEHNTDWCHGD